MCHLQSADGWSLLNRSESNNEIVADPAKFPSGIKNVSDYVHSKGKFSWLWLAKHAVTNAALLAARFVLGVYHVLCCTLCCAHIL